MIQNRICYSPCHKWRYGISDKRVLRDLLLTVVAAGLSFALEDKGVVKTLQACHFANRHGAIGRIVDEVVGHGADRGALAKRIEYHIVSLLRLQSFLFEFSLGLVIVLVLSDDLQPLANRFVFACLFDG